MNHNQTALTLSDLSTMIGQKIPELMTHLKAEYDGVVAEVGTFGAQRAEYEKRLESHLVDMAEFQQTLSELETAHKAIKSQYEAEVSLLKKQLAAATDNGANTTAAAAAAAVAAQAPAGSGARQALSETPSFISAMAEVFLNGNFGEPRLGQQQQDGGGGVGVGGVGGAADPSGAGMFGISSSVGAGGVGMGATGLGQASGSSQLKPLGGLDSMRAAGFPGPQGVPLGAADMQQGAVFGGQVPGRANERKNARKNQQMMTASQHQQQQQQQQQMQMMQMQMQMQQQMQPQMLGQPLQPQLSQQQAQLHPLQLQQLQQHQLQQQLQQQAQQNQLAQQAHQHHLQQQQQQQHLHGKPGGGLTMPLADNEGDWTQQVNPQNPTSLGLSLRHTFVHQSAVCCVVFSNDGRLLATGSDKCANLFNVETGEYIANLVDSSTKKPGEDLFIRSVAFSPDDRYLVAGAEDCIIKVWEITTRQLIMSLTGHTLDIYSILFTSDGERMVSGSGDKTIKVWNLATRSCVRTIGGPESAAAGIAGPTDGVTSIAVTRDSKLVAAGSLDKDVCMWEIETGRLVDQLKGHSASVYSVAFSPDSLTLVSGSFDNTVKVWDIGQNGEPSKLRCTLVGHENFVLSVCYLSNNWIVTGSKDRSVIFWDVNQPQAPRLVLQGHRNSVISVAVSKTGKVFATGSGDSRARIWSYTDLERK
jgi:glucose repression regulatory protein TUP1